MFRLERCDPVRRICILAVDKHCLLCAVFLAVHCICIHGISTIQKVSDRIDHGSTCSIEKRHLSNLRFIYRSTYRTSLGHHDSVAELVLGQDDSHSSRNAVVGTVGKHKVTVSISGHFVQTCPVDRLGERRRPVSVGIYKDVGRAGILAEGDVALCH